MLMFIKQPYYTTDAGGGANTIGGPMNVDDMVNFMKEGDDKPIDLKDNKTNKTTKTDKVEDNDKIDIKLDDDDEDKEVIDLKEPKEDDKENKEEEEEEDDLEEIPEDKLELLDHVSRKEILKEYPELFKKFPYLEIAYYRNLQFTELFGKPEDAKAAIEAKETLANFEGQLLNGDVTEVLKAVKEEDQEAFNKLVDNYLPTLEKVDPKMWEHVVGNLNKQTIYAMYSEGRRTSNEELMKAALHLNQFIFGTSEYTPPVKLAKEVVKTDKEKELEEKEKSFNQKQLDIHKSSVDTKVSNAIRSTIELNLDPNNKIDNDFLKEKAIEESINNLNQLMESDKKYMKNMDLLWDEAAKNNYEQKYLDKIKSAKINKARLLIKDVIRNTRNRVFKNASNKSNEDRGSRKGPLPQGKPAAQNSGHKSNTSDIKPGESAMDYMMRD